MSALGWIAAYVLGVPLALGLALVIIEFIAFVAIVLMVLWGCTTILPCCIVVSYVEGKLEERRRRVADKKHEEAMKKLEKMQSDKKR